MRESGDRFNRIFRKPEDESGSGGEAERDVADEAVKKYFDLLGAGSPAKDAFETVVQPLSPDDFNEFYHRLDIAQRQRELEEDRAVVTLDSDSGQGRYPRPDVDPKTLKHASGTPEDELLVQGPAEEDQDIVEKHSPRRQAERRKKIKQMDKAVRAGGELGKLRAQEKLTDETVAPEKSGKEDGKIGEAKFWKRPDGAVFEEIQKDRQGHVTTTLKTIAINGIHDFRGAVGWQRFDPAAGFVPMTKEELETWRTKEAADKRMREERARRSRGDATSAPPETNRTPNERPSSVQLSMNEGEPTPVSSPDEYGDVEAPASPHVGEVIPGSRSLSQAHQIFDTAYTEPTKLRQAYQEAVQGLSQENRDAFDDGLERVLPDVPSAILASIINEELRTNPPPKDRTYFIKEPERVPPRTERAKQKPRRSGAARRE